MVRLEYIWKIIKTNYKIKKHKIVKMILNTLIIKKLIKINPSNHKLIINLLNN